MGVYGCRVGCGSVGESRGDNAAREREKMCMTGVSEEWVDDVQESDDMTCKG